MSSPFRMMTSITSVMMIIIGIFFLFFNTSLDDQRSSAIRQIATTNLNRKAVRKLPTTNARTNQQILSHYSLSNNDTLTGGWSTSNNDTVTEYENAVWKQLYSKFGDKLSQNVAQASQLKKSYNGYQATSRTRTWLLNGVSKGTVIFSYLYKSSLDDVYAVKVQTIVSGRPYTINLAIIHDATNNNFGNYSGSPLIDTPTGTMSSEDHKSGATIAKTYTTDTGYNVVWDSEFVQKLKYGMDHIKLTYTFNQSGQAVYIPASLKEIYSNSSSAEMPVKIMQADASTVPFTISPSQISIKNGTKTNPASTIAVTLTKQQSQKFFNINFNSQQKMLFRVYTHITNAQVTSDYASGQAKMDTLDSSGNIIQTQTADASKVRITPFAVQPIDTGMSLSNATATLTHFVNKLYVTGDSSSTANNKLAQAQYAFANDANNIYVPNK